MKQQRKSRCQHLVCSEMSKRKRNPFVLVVNSGKAQRHESCAFTQAHKERMYSTAGMSRDSLLKGAKQWFQCLSCWPHDLFVYLMVFSSSFCLLQIYFLFASAAWKSPKLSSVTLHVHIEVWSHSTFSSSWQTSCCSSRFYLPQDEQELTDARLQRLTVGNWFH